MAEEGFKRKLVAIHNAYFQGYCLPMSKDEDVTIQTLKHEALLYIPRNRKGGHL